MKLIDCDLTIINEVHIKVTGLMSDDLRKLYDKFGFYVDGYKFIPAVQLGRWDRKKEIFRPTWQILCKAIA
jgi:hypothetical protein